jgi:RNA polymerase sigma factor (sigma-70 family)
VSSLCDADVAAAACGSHADVARVVAAVAAQARLMVAARLSATPAQMDAVDDIAQNAVSALSASLARLQNKTVGGLKAYFSGIVANKVADFLRRPPGRVAGGQAVSLDTTVAGFSESGPMWQLLSASGTSPLSAADRDDQVVRLMTELGRLKAEHREVISLAFFDQLPTGEIAERMGISRPAASMLLIRAIKALRRNMTGSSELQ